MTNFLLDLWHDLRAKRLWPVAAVLALALVAVPVLLKKSSSDAAPAPAAPSSPSASAAANGKPVVVADTGTTKASSLGVFDPKNPFRPDHMPKAPGSTSSPGPSAPSTTTQAPSSGGGTGSAPSTPPSSGGGTGGGQPSQPTQPKAGSYAYTVDVKFGKRGELRTRHGLQKLDLLPNANNPLLVFLGVNAAGDTAVFLTDTSLKAAGEGTCKPNDDVCSFLYLKVDDGSNTEDLSEQSSDGTGTEYTLKLLAIHKVPVSKLAKKSQSKAAKKAAARRARQLRHKPGTPFHLLFTLPQLPDVVG